MNLSSKLFDLLRIDIDNIDTVLTQIRRFFRSCKDLGNVIESTTGTFTIIDYTGSDMLLVRGINGYIDNSGGGATCEYNIYFDADAGDDCRLASGVVAAGATKNIKVIYGNGVPLYGEGDIKMDVAGAVTKIRIYVIGFED